MISLQSAKAADFHPALNEDFELLTGTGGITLTLVSAGPRGPGHEKRPEPFVLTFRGAPVLRLQQAVYRLQNVTLGPMEIFLVQTDAREDGSYFEAIFN